jgi:glycine oxidase
MSTTASADVVIAGSGIIGLSLGLELLRRGASVLALERDAAMRGASWAAGGMLAARDVENPAKLSPLSLRSLELYPEYLAAITAASGKPIPIRTRHTLHPLPPLPGAVAAPGAQLAALAPGLAPGAGPLAVLEEESLDPRDLCEALPLAFQACGGTLLEHTELLRVTDEGSHLTAETSRGEFCAAHVVDCRGAAAGDGFGERVPVFPVKGQMVNVGLPPERLRCVIRTPGFYVIPRGDGRVTVGATIERNGFDRTVEADKIRGILTIAGQTLPELGQARVLETWAGLRPGTPDELPVLGASNMRNGWYATGHYRNGILLAPATARVLAQWILGESPDVALKDFSPQRFAKSAGTASKECRMATLDHAGAADRL